MWAGRFREAPDAEFDTWQRSFAFDRRLLPYECAASRAHALALLDAGVLTRDEQGRLDSALAALAELDVATLHDDDAEDVHHFVERRLVAELGDLGRKLHAGRSRNEQIATDLRLFVRDAAAQTQQALVAWAAALVAQAHSLGDAAMPSYTHLQRAEPVLAGHWLLAYVEMALRDVSRLEDCARRANVCPLGSGAVAGATLALDRSIAARELGFAAATANSMDATSDRDFALEFLHCLSQVALHMSRFAEEITLFSTTEFGFIRLPEAFSTGSSAMPQKKNSDLTELLRGKTGRIISDSHAVEILLKGLPLAYNKDLQETQPPLFAATEESLAALRLVARFTAALDFDTARMRSACESGFLNAMAAATYLSARGVPFRDAHEVIGVAVRLCLVKGCELDGLSLEELRGLDSHFDTDFYSAITMRATLDCHDVVGGTASARVKQALRDAEERVAALQGAMHAST